VYDVLYRDHTHRESVVATGLGREAACEVARAEAERRGVGRMFLVGSDPDAVADAVLIVETQPQAA